MKILAITADIIPGRLGGAEGHFIEIAIRLTPKLETLTIIVGDSNEVHKLLPKSKVITVSYPHIQNLFGLIYIIYASIKGFNLMRKEKFDLIWAKQEFPQAQVGAILKNVFKVPLYITCQNPLMHKEELVASNFLVDKFKNFLTPLICWAFSMADVVACVSKFSRENARKMGAKNTVVIPNGVDVLKFKNSKSKKESPVLRIVTVSSLAPRYGIDTLIEACKLLNVPYKLLIAGDGPDFEKLKNISDKNVKFLGRVDNNKIPKLLAGSDVFVRASRYEGFGAVFIEAMACKIPVIATPVGGITDFVTNEETGLLVAPNNPIELRNAIERMARDTKLREKLIHNGYKLVKEKYNWDTIADSVYKEMIKCQKVL